jgi:hypothetical protein
MSDTATQADRPKTLSDLPWPLPVAVIAAIGFVGGIWWLPAWLLAGQIVRIWSQRGCMTWLKSRGVPEYTDDKYANWIGYAPIILIAVRVVFSLNWLEPFQALQAHHLDTTPTPENSIFLSLVFGLALATAMTGVLKVYGPLWIISLAGFIAVAVLVVGGYGAIWTATALEGSPLIILAYFVSHGPMQINKILLKRARRPAEEALEESSAAK